MINTKQLFFAQNVSRITSVHLTKIDPYSIDGFCGCNCMGELAAYVINHGYSIEFHRTDSSSHTSDFIIVF